MFYTAVQDFTPGRLARNDQNPLLSKHQMQGVDQTRRGTPHRDPWRDSAVLSWSRYEFGSFATETGLNE